MGKGTMKPEWKLVWYASPLDENPDVIFFDFWGELEDWVCNMEQTVDCFDINLCIIEKVGE